jgi:hypothetical protein
MMNAATDVGWRKEFRSAAARFVSTTARDGRPEEVAMVGKAHVYAKDAAIIAMELANFQSRQRVAWRAEVE